MKAVSVLFIFLFLFSCTHENENNDYAVRIGESSKYYTIIKPSPIIVVTESHQDSIDLNSDGIFEIKFKLSTIPTSSVPGSKTEIITNNQLQILLSDKNFEDPDTLNLHSNLKIDLHWSENRSELSENEFHLFTLRSYACYSYEHCLSTGNFDNVYDKYIGYKLGEKFGWILVDSRTSELKIKEYTVLK